jgi:CRISPR-associated endonuclease Cas1
MLCPITALSRSWAAAGWDRDGTVLASTGPVRPSDAKLRRAQVLAHNTSVALEIARELIRQKVEAQHALVKNRLSDGTAAIAIAAARESIAKARTLGEVRLFESRAAYAYWSAWRNLPVDFPKRDLHRVPGHWRTFGTRFSPLTRSPRLAVNPPNAILNYLYAVLESEARLAISTLGLDPGLGFLHADSQARDSLACDVMEPLRPQVDAYLLDWISRETLRREWFFELCDGNCRLMGSIAARLSETASKWEQMIGPIAEWVAHAVWSTSRKSTRRKRLATRLTQEHRRDAKGVAVRLTVTQTPRPESFCKHCGVKISRGRRYCANCVLELNTAGLVKAAQAGRIAAQSEDAQTFRADTQRRHAAAKAGWKASDLPTWLNESSYSREIQPRLRCVTLSALASALGISIPYAVDVRKGKRIPHPRHWKTLAELTGTSTSQPRITSRLNLSQCCEPTCRPT